ncbi:MAG: hypothetical protein JWO09_2574 [Bacteroidetes bacterium]|nr:hypothetical protein [Bacteroidota bacterium]
MEAFEWIINSGFIFVNLTTPNPSWEEGMLRWKNLSGILNQNFCIKCSQDQLPPLRRVGVVYEYFFFFFLDKKETKNQESLIAPRSATRHRRLSSLSAAP